MNKLQLFETENDWNNILSTYNIYDVYFKYEYHLLWCKNEDKPFICITTNGNEFIVHPFIKRQIPIETKVGEKNYDLISPYGFSGLFISDSISSETIINHNKQLSEYCNEHSIVSEFVRFNPFHSHIGKLMEIYELIYIGDTIYVDLRKTMDEIFREYQHNNRKNIKKAEREGIEVVFEFKEIAKLKEYFELYNHTMERNDADEFYKFTYEFFERISKKMKNNVFFAHAIKDGRIISTELVTYDKKIGYSFLGGTLEEFYPSRPNNLLKHKIVEKLKNMGVEYYYLGGGYSKEDGIYNYKKSFAPNNTKEFYVGRKIYNQEKYDELVSNHFKNISSNEIINRNYFPLYRAPYEIH